MPQDHTPTHTPATTAPDYQALRRAGKISRLNRALFRHLFGSDEGKPRLLSLVNALVHHNEETITPGEEPVFTELSFSNFGPYPAAREEVVLDLVCRTTEETPRHVVVHLAVDDQPTLSRLKILKLLILMQICNIMYFYKIAMQLLKSTFFALKKYISRIARNFVMQ